MSTQNPTPDTLPEQVTTLSEQVPDATATPRTDALRGVPMTRADSDDFARTLERELSSAQAALTAAKAEIARLNSHEGDLVIGCAIVEGARRQEARAVDRLEADSAALRAEVERLNTADSFSKRELARGNEIIDGLRQERDQLRARVAELEADKARLDWLLSRGVCWRGCNAELMGEGWVVGHETEWLYDVQGQGRARIDKGIAARAGKGAT